MKARVIASIACLLVLSLACGMLEVNVEGTPGADPAVTGTIGALQTQNAELATRAALRSPAVALATPMTVIPRSGQPETETPQPATRITFLSGATVGVVSAPIGAGQTQTYVLDVFQAQPMLVSLHSPNNDLTVSIAYEDGSTLLSESAKQNSWRGNLPKTGDYFLTVHGGAVAENFTLVVTVPLPVHFAQGTDSLTINSKTIAGYDVSYDVYASKGQSMNINIEQISSKGSLAVYGFQDGQQYLRADAGQKTFELVLPATQDYIVSVVPFDGLVLDYIVTITIK
jgi:hypothetical protein